jgi:hypothetical protein
MDIYADLLGVTAAVMVGERSDDRRRVEGPGPPRANGWYTTSPGPAQEGERCDSAAERLGHLVGGLERGRPPDISTF